jgi:hypothetical protein
VNIKIAGKWMFIPLKMVLIGIDPYPYIYNIYPYLDGSFPKPKTWVSIHQCHAGRPGEAAPSRPSLPSRFRGESPAFFAPPESPRCATWKMNENDVKMTNQI